MFQKFVFLLLLSMTVISCQFTETMVLNEDGSGRMSIEIDMGEMMAFGAMAPDSVTTKIDTLISMKQILEEKKDSIATLSISEQEKMKKLENYQIRMLMNSETSELSLNLFSDFKSVEETNDIMDGFGDTSSYLPNMGADMNLNKDDSSADVMGVSYHYKNGKFKRDAYIKSKEKHQAQVDSMKNAESWMGSMKYRLKYTFPRKIKKSSIKDATYSLDGKTIEVERSMVEYMKDPDVLDLEVDLEKQ
jgi:hypothetical protein